MHKIQKKKRIERETTKTLQTVIWGNKEAAAVWIKLKMFTAAVLNHGGACLSSMVKPALLITC